jgi:NMD protein affecting ribosome stability and mRNA decay
MKFNLKDSWYCKSCGKATTVLLQDVCRECFDAREKTPEEWFVQLNGKIDDIMEQITEINLKLKGGE